MIPVKSLNYIRPKSGIGPFSIQGLSNVAGNVPDGHFVFGWASVQCPDCITRKDYWVLIKEGETAWYSKIQPEEQTSIWKNLSSVIDSGENYPQIISELVPKKNRIAVEESLMNK